MGRRPPINLTSTAFFAARVIQCRSPPPMSARNSKCIFAISWQFSHINGLLLRMPLFVSLPMPQLLAAYLDCLQSNSPICLEASIKNSNQCFHSGVFRTSAASPSSVSRLPWLRPRNSWLAISAGRRFIWRLVSVSPSYILLR